MANSSSTRVAVVTGANKGIGFGIVKDLCSDFNGVVYLTSRDVGRGQKAVEELNAIGGLQPRYFQVDLDDEASVLRLRDFLLENYGGLDVLVNNAAIMFPMTTPKNEYGEAARKTIQTNFYHTKRVCDVLFPLLKPHARVVNLTSDDGHLSKVAGREPEASQLRKRFSNPELTIEELCKLMDEFVEAAQIGDYYEKGWPNCVNEREPQWPNESYMMSKVGISALTRIQQREFDLHQPDKDIIVNAVHPGYVATDATHHLGTMTVEEGSKAASWLANLPPSTQETGLPRGAYVWHDKQIVDWIEGVLPETYN